MSIRPSRRSKATAISSPASIGAPEPMRTRLPHVLAAILSLALIFSSASAEAQAAAGRGGGVKVGTGGGIPDVSPRLPGGPLFGLDGEGTPPTIPGAGGPPPDQGEGPHDPDLLVVVFRRGTPDGTTADFAGAFKLTIEKQYEL